MKGKLTVFSKLMTPQLRPPVVSVTVCECDSLQLLTYASCHSPQFRASGYHHHDLNLSLSSSPIFLYSSPQLKQKRKGKKHLSSFNFSLMADGFELFHVPQQSRRDRLRILAAAAAHQNNPTSEPPTVGGCAGLGLLPLYDPSLLSSALLTNYNNPLVVDGKIEVSKPNPLCVSSVRDRGMNFMGYGSDFINTLPSSSSSSYNHHHHHHQSYSDQPSSVIHNSIQDIRVFDQSFNGGGGMVAFKPESLSSLTHDASTLGHGLSLSLSSQQTHHQHNQPLELNNVERIPVSLGLFTGCGLILKQSRFLKPTKQLLDEICDVGRGNYQVDASNLMDPQLGVLNAADIVDDGSILSDQDEHSLRKSRLISILDEVYQRYKQYNQQIHAVVESFESVAGLDNAAPNISFALNVLSKHFRCLKNMITGQLRFTSKAQSEGTFTRHDDAPSLGISHKRHHNLTQVQNLGIDEPRVWQPQRGLPQRAVATLRAWLFEHFLHPYPTDTDKQMLAKETGLSRSQVANWFVNARVRIWKPMVEEVHMLETLQAQLPSSIEDRNNRR